MLEIEIDGKKAQVADGSTVMDAASQLGIYIPHFCYHKKLSIAANCRMCLVQVEKAPKPLPACATPVTNGMKVFTHSELAVTAQKGVMEFLLINHPLDCPICDQGGECQLQDLAVGYGQSGSRFTEEKHVVFHKNVGPLISMEEMSRCIHCTRCVRFGQEVAGVMELGMLNRNVHSEISTFVGKTVDSELSGNMIDICPVGALTSKPFRYSARTWELQRRKSVSPHDATGANVTIQIKGDVVKRVLPFDNENVNECWISDKDRFSYESLNSSERLLKPMLKQGGQWQEVEWNVALDYVAHGLRSIAKDAGGDQIATVVSPHATLEEMYLAGRITRALGSDNIDFRLRQQDFRADALRPGAAPWLGLPLADLSNVDAALIVGGFLRKDAPLVAQRLRHAARKGASVFSVNVTSDDSLIKHAGMIYTPPGQLVAALAGVVRAAAEIKGVQASALAALGNAGELERKIATALIGEPQIESGPRAIVLGNVAVQHPDYSLLEQLAGELATITGASAGTVGEAANSVGGYIAKAMPQQGGRDAARLFAEPRKAYVLFGCEPSLDVANPAQALRALNAADMVVQFASFKDADAMAYADVLLPLSPFTETSGTFVNGEGVAQSFVGVVRTAGDSRPGWKLLRVLGNLLNVERFDYQSSEEVRNEMLGADNCLPEGALACTLPVTVSGVTTLQGSGLQRIADVPIYFADALVRRSPSLQKTKDAQAPTARMNAATLAQVGAADGRSVRVKGSEGSATLNAVLDNTVPDGCVRIAAAHPSTATIGALNDMIVVECV
ncbi:MAG: NADH-quinone oxidoreductase subunit NuoG [Fluviibacter sp.]